MKRILNTRAWMMATACYAATLAASASADTLSYSIMLCENLSVLENPTSITMQQMAALTTQHQLMLQRTNPYIELRNTSDSADITHFTMSIGDLSKNFDLAQIIDASPGVIATISDPDALMGHLRTDLLTISFTGFTPGSYVRLRTGLAPDDPNLTPLVDYRDTFFDLNGVDTANNSLLTVTYATGEGDVTESNLLPNFSNPARTATSLARFHCWDLDSVLPFSAEFSTEGPPTPPIPEPSSVVLAALGMIALAGWRWRAASGR